MANLVTVTKESRIILKIGGIVAGLILVLYLIFQGGSLISSIFFPKPEPAPLQALGQLPHIAFPESSSSDTITYIVNTVDGQLPILPNRVNVYKLTSPDPNLLALQTAKQTLDSENYTLNQIKKTNTLYQWTQARTGATIDYDIVTKNFSVSSNYIGNQLLASQGLMPDEERIKSDMISYLSRIEANTSNLDQEKTKVEYLEIQNGALIAATNLGSARYARVTLTQSVVDEIPIVYDTPSESILNFLISYTANGFTVLEGQFFNHGIDIENKSDYPIKTAQQALADLEKGNAYIINPQNLTNVDITNVELRYYLNRGSDKYLLPVIVFTGVNNFYAYVEAIPDLSLEEKPLSE